MLQPNQVLQGRYRIIKVMGQGGMGAVYQAYDQRLDNACVVKEMLITAEVADKLDEAARQFQREAATLARLRHPGLPVVHDYFRESDNYYLVMDLVKGQSLRDLIPAGGLAETVVLNYADQLLEVLAYIHACGVLHRDIKPDNIIVQPDGRAVLVDFGLVKVAGISGKTATKSFLRGLGTPEYAPPEQYSGGTDQRSDLYSLAATLYHALIGQAPPSVTDQLAGTKLQPMRQLRGDVSANTERVILKALSLDRDARYPDADTMRAAFGKVAPPVKPGKPGVAPTRVLTTPLMQVGRSAPAYRRKIGAGVGGGALIVGLVIAVLILPRITAPANPVQPTSAIATVTLYSAMSPTAETDATPTYTPTSTPTNTPTATPTDTPSPTPTPTNTPVTPTPTNTPVTPSPTATQDVGASQQPADTCNPKWFFTPWPANEGCPQNKRSAPAAMQVYEKGRIMWLGDADLSGQVFVFYPSGSWENIAGSIDSVGLDKAGQLGQPSGARSNFTTCAAHSNSNGVVTAYVSDAAGNILSWSISAGDFAHLGWRYVPNARFSGCG
jgi:eukaryotic-like serine/threonine-protein kinase